MSAHSLLALGKFDRRERELLSVVATESGYSLTLSDHAEAANQQLEAVHPRAILVDTRLPDNETFALAVRAQAAHALTPVIALTDDVSDLAFADAFSWGGDDAVDLRSERGLLSRLRRLPSEILAPTSAKRGVAVVADPDRARRLVRARVLRNAGYQIRFAVSVDELEKTCEDAALVVADAELDGVTEHFASSVKRHPGVHYLLLAAPRHLGKLSALLFVYGNVLVADGFAPPENIVFLANELSGGGAGDKRSSKRLLYGSRVVFRGEGREQDEVGYSYNISSGGLYVRSLAVPEDDRVWLELRPPRSDRLVRLEGEVVWRRPFGPSGFATVPPGFGIRIADATQSNRDAWNAGYQAFASVLATAWSNRPGASAQRAAVS